MPRPPRSPCRLLLRLESLRAFLSREEKAAQDVEFRIASLAARIAAGARQRRCRRWRDVDEDLLALLRDLFGENMQLFRTFLPRFSEQFLRAKLLGLAKAAPPASPARPQPPPAPVEEYKEVSLRDLKDLTASTPDLAAARARKRPESQSVRLERSGKRFEISALSITDVSDFPLSQRAAAGGRAQCPASPLPCFSLAQWGLAASPRAIIERL